MSKQLIDETEVLDRALDAAETILGPYTQLATPENIVAAFVRHCETHLPEELENIAEHGHRNDDPADTPPVVPSLVDAVLEWARTPGNHGGNPYCHAFVRLAQKIKGES